MSSLATQATTGGGGGSGLGSLLLIALPLLLIGYLIFSQRKRQKDMAKLQASLSIGDEAVSTTGLFGRIVDLEERVVHLEISDGVVVRYDRRGIVPAGGTTSAAETRDTDEAGPGNPATE